MFSFDIDYKKKRVILSLLGLIAGCVFTFAQQRSEEEALQVAQSFFGKEARARGAAPTKAQMTLVPPQAVDKLIIQKTLFQSWIIFIRLSMCLMTNITRDLSLCLAMSDRRGCLAIQRMVPFRLKTFRVVWPLC